MTMSMTLERDAILKNIQVWHKDRADALANKAERKRKQLARQKRQAFTRGFNSIGELLPHIKTRK